MKNKSKRRIVEGRSAGGTIDFNPDYTPVIRDLKRIGLLAGIFLAILVGLAFAMPTLMP